jgi:hypothetical protein
MFYLPCSKLPSPQFCAARLSPPLRCPSCPFFLLYPFLTRSPITATTSRRQPSSRSPTMLHPRSLMDNQESELLDYMTGRFLYVSYSLSHLCLTRNVTRSEPTRPFALESVGTSLIFSDSSKSWLRHFVVTLKRLWLSKNLGEGDFNCTFLATLDTGP